MMRFLIVLFIFLGVNSVWAEQSTPATSPPSSIATNVTMLVQAEMWATTDTAKVTSRIDALLNKTGLEQIYKNVMQKLSQLDSKGVWHITSFNRTQDKSGLEQVEIIAETRLPLSELAGIRDRAQSISRPGEAYSIENIDFHPSAEDIEATRSRLRAKIYDQSKVELNNLNKAYPNQHFTLHMVNFLPDIFYSGGSAQKPPVARIAMMAMPPPLTASDKVTMRAVIEFIANSR
jgi:hypothetical protein